MEGEDQFRINRFWTMARGLIDTKDKARRFNEVLSRGIAATDESEIRDIITELSQWAGNAASQCEDDIQKGQPIKTPCMTPFDDRDAA